MPTGILIAFKLERSEKEIGMSSACKLYRKLYGYENYSYYGRYHTRVPGILDEIPSIRYFNSLILVRKEDAERIVSFLREREATVLYWEVKLRPDEAGMLKLK